MRQASALLGQSSMAVDTNVQSLLYRKKDQFCVTPLGKEKKKESNCYKSASLKYLYPSQTGFWFTDSKTSELVHIDQKKISKETISTSDHHALEYRGTSDDIAIQYSGITQLFVIQDVGIKKGDLISETCKADINAIFGGEKDSRHLVLFCYWTGREFKRDLKVEAIKVVDGAIKARKDLGSITTHGPIEHIWVNYGQNTQNNLMILYQNSDLVYTNEKGVTQWEIANDFSNIQELLTADFTFEGESEDVPTYDSFGANFIGAYLYRVTKSTQYLVQFVSSIIPRILSFNIQDIIAKVVGGQKVAMEDVNYYNKYGLRKNLIFVTKSQKLISVDSLNGKTLWSKSMNPGQTIVKALVNARNNIDLIYEQAGQKKRTEINSLDGSFISQDQPVDSKATLFLEGESAEAPIEIGFENDFLKNAQKEYSFYKVQKYEGIMGYRRASNGKFEQTWNYYLEPGEQIIGYSYHLKGDNQYISRAAEGSVITLPEAEALYYKIVDSGNVALFIKKEINGKSVLVLVLINTLRGKVLGTYLNSEVDFSQPVVYIYDDNGVYISYFNSRLSGFELWSIELFKVKVETKFLEMLQKYVLKWKKEEELDYSKDSSQIVILDRKYGLPVGLKSLTAVTTPHGLTRRNLIAITTSNNVISLDRILISARRADPELIKASQNKKKLSYYSMMYPPYDYFLPVLDMHTLNANWRLAGVEHIKVVQTKFESTSLVVAYGKDLFVTRVQPDSTFDLLNDDFNYTMLGVVAVIITVLAYILRRLSSRAEAKRKYFTS